MKKQILAAAIAATFIGAPLAASAETTLYGQFAYEVGAIETGTDREAQQSYRGTRIGIRGGEDLGGGLRANFKLQGNINGGPGTSHAFNEEVWVGFSGGFGEVRLGQHDTAFKKANVRFRQFADMLPEGSVAVQGPNNFSPRNNARAQGLHYTTPNFGGVKADLTLANRGPGLSGDNKDTYVALGLQGALGPITLSAAVENSDVDLTNDKRTNFGLGASFSAAGLTTGLLFQSLENAMGDDDFSYYLPIAYRMGNIGLRATIQYFDPDTGDDATDFALGASYFMSKRTQVLTNLWSTNDTDETQFSVGVRHSF